MYPCPEVKIIEYGKIYDAETEVYCGIEQHEVKIGSSIFQRISFAVLQVCKQQFQTYYDNINRCGNENKPLFSDCSHTVLVKGFM